MKPTQSLRHVIPSERAASFAGSEARNLPLCDVGLLSGGEDSLSKMGTPLLKNGTVISTEFILSMAQAQSRDGDPGPEAQWPGNLSAMNTTGPHSFQVEPGRYLDFTSLRSVTLGMTRK